VVLGIGINLAPPSVPPPDWDTLNPHPFPATCVEGEPGTPIDLWPLLHAVMRNVLAWRERMMDDDFLRAWEANLAVRDQQVWVYQPGSVTRPKAVRLLGLGADGSLRVQDESGGQVTLQAGEIHQANPPLGGFRLRPVDSAEK
jgi:biotin-(acetyl-CoA carboxylase) ligase